MMRQRINANNVKIIFWIVISANRFENAMNVKMDIIWKVTTVVVFQIVVQNLVYF